MNTKILRNMILEADVTGKNIRALSLCVFGLVFCIATGITGITRLIGGYYASGGTYLIIAVICGYFLAYGVININAGEPEKISKIAYPLVIGVFIFGLTVLFFVDGGFRGGVPIYFILASVATPCFLKFDEAIIILPLEFASFLVNSLFEKHYPGAVNLELATATNKIFPIIIVTASLGVLCLLYLYTYQSQQMRLEKAISDANSANEAKSSFLDNMSHEIRTPMNSILGMNEMIIREEDRPEILEYANVIQRSGRALLGIINDILDFSKLQDKKMEIVATHYDLSSLINDMVNIASEQAKKKSLTFDINVDKTIPRILDGDEYHIRQVTMNILNNAIKFTERGGITVNIGYEVLSEDSISLKCSISDTGVGIKSEDIEQIFKPFEYVESSKKYRADGSGLGLSIVQKLLHLMGSDLRVESVFHKGSTFSFEIKQTVLKWEPIGDYERAFNVSVSHHENYNGSFQAPNARVLVVDDADVNLLVFANLLKKTKIKIDTASSGMEMLQLIRINKYDMIFLDHRMPGMDGVEAFHQMKKITDGINFNTPVVALTANAVLGARKMYMDEGFSDYISKPVDTVRLEQVLLEYLPPELILRGDDMIIDEPAPKKINKLPENGTVNLNLDVSDSVPEPEPEPEEEASPYKNIQGIDYEAAVTNCGAEETFIQALEIFYNTLDKKADDIEKFEREKDIKNYTVLVHALKSAARLVGALNLSADAKYLEECGDKNDVEEIEKKTPALLSQYRSYKEILAKVFGKKEDEDLSKPEISPSDLNELYSLIKGMAANFDLDNIDKMIEETKNYRIPASEKEKFEKVKDCITAADWATLDQLLS